MAMRRAMENPKIELPAAMIELYNAGGAQRYSLFSKFVVNENNLAAISLDIIKELHVSTTWLVIARHSLSFSFWLQQFSNFGSMCCCRNGSALPALRMSSRG